MVRYLLAVAAAFLAAPVGAAAPVPADGGKGTSFPYPAKAPVVVCLNGYDKARDRLNKMIAAALPDDAARITKLFDDGLTKLLDGRKLTAVRKDARAFFVLNDLANLVDGDAAMSVLVPVSAYKDFRESFLTKEELKTFEKGRDGVDAIKSAAFGEEMSVFLIDLNDYVALTADKATADGYAAKYTAGTAEPMGAELAEAFLKADLAVYVNMDAINNQFGDQIKGFRGLIDFGLQQAQQGGMIPGLGKKQMDALKVVFTALFQGIEDCRGIVAGVEFRPDGLAVRFHARFDEDTPSAKLIARENSGPLPNLAKLPPGLGMYQAMKFGKTIGDAFRGLSGEFSTTEDDARGAMLIEQHLLDLAAAGHGGDYTASGAPGRALIVSEYKEPGKAVTALTKSYKAVAAGGKVNSMVVKAAPRVQDDAQPHRDFKFSSILLKYDFDATVAGLPEPIREGTLAALKRATNETANVWIGTDGKVVLQVTAKDWAEAKGLVDAYLDGKAGVGGEAGFKLTRAQLPADASLLLVAETEAALHTIADSMRPAGDAIPGFPKIELGKPEKGDRTYVGVALSLKGDTAGVTAFVPTGAVKVARKMIDGLLKKVE